MLNDFSLTVTALIGVGLMFFVAFMVFDDIEIGGVPLGQALGTLLTGVGASSLITHSITQNPPLSLAVGLAAGLILMVGVVKLMKALKKSSHDGRELDYSELKGQEVAVVWWDSTSGEVLVKVSGQTIKVAGESRRSINSATPKRVADFELKGTELVKVRLEANI